jgi:hypothetical protein
MMCVIVDTNLAFRVLTPAPEDDFRPVFDWLHAADKDGCLVFGGKLFKELSNRTASRRYLRALSQAGRAYQIPDARAQDEEQRVTCSGLCQSDDPHVVALARVSGARTLCSHDQALHQDFRNPRLIAKPRGRGYQNSTHTHLLRHDYCCPRGDHKRRPRKS